MPRIITLRGPWLLALIASLLSPACQELEPTYPDPLISELQPAEANRGDRVLVYGEHFGREGEGTYLIARPDGQATQFDLTPDVRDWTDGRVAFVVPNGLADGLYWLSIAHDDTISAEVALHIGDVPDGPDAGADVDEGGTPTLSYIQDEIFTPSCATLECHGEARAGNLRLTPGLSRAELVDVPSAADATLIRVVPGRPEFSLLVDKVSSETPIIGDRMPRESAPLTDAEIDLIIEWIRDGAADD